MVAGAASPCGVEAITSPAKSMPGIIGKRRTTGALPVIGQAVLVVDRRMGDAHGDVALHQVALVELGELAGIAGVGLGDDEGLEGRHGILRSGFRLLVPFPGRRDASEKAWSDKSRMPASA